jgi:SLIT-ROBO Rho GTPase activating protein
LVAQTKRQARDHALLSDIYANTVIQRLGQVTEEVQRIYRRVSFSLSLLFSIGLSK